jgi:hypothetical protein
MLTEQVIPLDTHCQFCEMVALSHQGRIVKRERCEATHNSS